MSAPEHQTRVVDVEQYERLARRQRTAWIVTGALILLGIAVGCLIAVLIATRAANDATNALSLSKQTSLNLCLQVKADRKLDRDQIRGNPDDTKKLLGVLGISQDKIDAFLAGAEPLVQKELAKHPDIQCPAATPKPESPKPQHPKPHDDGF